MVNFFGKHKCKVDDKGRISFPAKFLRQLPAEADKSVFISIGFDGCLNIRAKPEWDLLIQQLRTSLNPFNRKHREFKRLMLHGAEEISFDSNHRMLIPKLLFKEVVAEKEVYLLGQDDYIELWGVQKFASLHQVDVDALDKLGSDIFADELPGMQIAEDE